MAFDSFMKIGDIEGESADDKHKGEIEILSFSWGVSQQGTFGHGGGAGSGKVSVHDISITKFIDKASPVLMQKCCTGEHFPTAVLTCRKGGNDGVPVDYVKITLTDVLISSYSAAGNSQSDALPMEQVSLSYVKIAEDVIQINSDGTPVGKVTGSCGGKAVR